MKKRSGIELQMDGFVPPEQNIVYKAVRLFQDERGDDTGWFIRLDKRIPLGSGLGGGSSDAATVLLVLNELTGNVLSYTVLEALGAKLGSDVPFFIRGGTSYVTGRGEQIEAVSIDTPWAVVLVNPGIHSGTPEAFSLLDTFRQKQSPKSRPSLGKEELVRILRKHPKDWTFYNDFLEVFLERGSSEIQGTYRRIFYDLKEHGADFTGLSGSGSTCFGVFSDLQRARIAAKTLLTRWPFVELTFPLARRGNTVVQ